ncbi:hypothetical protein ABZ863_26600 [Saccharomonospora sp. NPDC046836]|uniref:hypothetical protein n=1 Tax=Saccharomonospora sp. NPDC046836 TaxID=3156921 RepID=UPI0033E77201
MIGGKKMTEPAKAVGVVLMADDSAVEGTPEQLSAVEYRLPWVVQDPAFWPLPLHTVMAKDADSEALLGHATRGVDSVVDSAKSLDGKVQLIIGNCGFMWAAAKEISESVATPTITSGLHLLNLALDMTSQQVAVLTYDANSLRPLLQDHEQFNRLSIVGFNDLPDWAAIEPADYMERGGWTIDGLRQQLVDRLEEAFASGGDLSSSRIIVLECTGLINFRTEIREVTGRPVLDIVSFAISTIS